MLNSLTELLILSKMQITFSSPEKNVYFFLDKQKQNAERKYAVL